MQVCDVLQLRGSLVLAILNAETGEEVDRRVVNNTVVTVGRAWALGQLQSVNHVTGQNISYMGIGSGLVAPTTADTALGAEVTRVAISSFATSGLTVNPPSWQAQAVFATSHANTTLGEVNLVNSSAAGTQFARATFTSFVKATSNTLAISYTISG